MTECSLRMLSLAHSPPSVPDAKLEATRLSCDDVLALGGLSRLSQYMLGHRQYTAIGASLRSIWDELSEQASLIFDGRPQAREYDDQMQLWLNMAWILREFCAENGLSGMREELIVAGLGVPLE